METNTQQTFIDDATSVGNPRFGNGLSIPQSWVDHAHEVAIPVNNQLDAKVSGVTSPLTSQDCIDLNRFWATCEDGEGYDVPKERMKRLKHLGLVDGGRFGVYYITDLGNELHDARSGPRGLGDAQAGAVDD